MKLKLFAGLLMAASLVVSCDDNTDEIGTSLINNVDKLEISTDTFTVTTRSIIADSVLSRNTIGYLGKVKDPLTGAYITGDFMSQFHVLEDYTYPEKDSIRSLAADGQIVADSCEIRLYYNEFYGDSLAAMKLTAYELDKPMEETSLYYSNFNPIEEGFVRTDGLKTDKVYSLCDLSISESERTDDDYTPNIRIKLDKPYTDKNGVTYNNFGTYIMRKYYENPSYFKNSYAFTHNVVPGFYFKSKSGLGSMAYVSISQMNVYFTYSYASTKTGTDGVEKDTVIVGTGVSSFAGTEEVLQTTNVTNDNSALARLANDNTCTYLKTPAGIFTEMTIPVDEIMNGHENDTLNTAKVVLTRINNVLQNEYNLAIPQTLLMIPSADRYSFFEGNKVADYKTSFLASYNSSYNTYTFNNISNLVKHLYQTADRSKEDWNKVVIIPVTTTVNTSSELTKVSHDMSLTNTRLVGGSENGHSPIKISVVYSKFKKQ